MAVKKKGRKKKGRKKKISLSAPSRTTGKKPGKRLKKRRKKNVEKGYYPNPLPVFYVGYVMNGTEKFYYHGYNVIKKALSFKDTPEGAMWYRSPKKAKDEIEYLTQRITGEKQRIKTERYRPK